MLNSSINGLLDRSSIKPEFRFFSVTVENQPVSNFLVKLKLTFIIIDRPQVQPPSDKTARRNVSQESLTAHKPDLSTFNL